MSVHSTFSNRIAATVALLASALVCATSQAAPRVLSDAEMSSVRGADGSILAGLAPPLGSSTGSPDATQNNLTKGLSAAFSSSTGSTLLTPAEFATALAPSGMAPSMMPGYDGQPVIQTKVDAAPITFSFDVSAILQSTTGLSYTGPSMGTITMKDFDARGTTIWVWQHH
jgi:hypothetical protein